MASGDTRQLTFVALGDSTTAGLGDPLPGGGWRGWAVHLAEVLGAVRLSNLAVSGATVAAVRENQLPAALALRPAIASVLVGVNDTLRSGFEPAVIADHLDHTVGRLTDNGATVLTARMPDPGRMFGLPGVLRRPLSRRVGLLNDATDRIAARYGTVHLDIAAHPSTYDRLMWSVDRLHPSERGHRTVARNFAELLANSGWTLSDMPSVEPGGGADTTAWDHFWWLATEGTRWVARRCTDMAPYLVSLAAREVLDGVRRKSVRTSTTLQTHDTT